VAGLFALVPCVAADRAKISGAVAQKVRVVCFFVANRIRIKQSRLNNGVLNRRLLRFSATMLIWSSAMKAAEVMTRRVLTVAREGMLDDAIRVMLQNRISGLPVVDEAGKPVGMLTEGDLLRRAETQTERKRPRWLEFLRGPGKIADEYIHTHSRRVKEVMSSRLISAAPDTPLEDVVKLMERHHIKRLPILDDGHLVGIISRANLLQALSVVAHDIPSSAASDDEIRARLWNEINTADWAPSGLINIIVRDGVVHLSGMVTTAREREALRVAAENTPGVKSVQSELVWCEPLSGTVVDLSEEETATPKDQGM
jgi:CBS domain-containing protein